MEDSGWQTDPVKLERFMGGINAEGGYKNEAIEVALWHANQAIDEVGGAVSQIIIIGDAKPNELKEAQDGLRKFKTSHPEATYPDDLFCDTEVEKIRQRNPPVSIRAFYVETKPINKLMVVRAEYKPPAVRKAFDMLDSTYNPASRTGGHEDLDFKDLASIEVGRRRMTRLASEEILRWVLAVNAQ